MSIADALSALSAVKGLGKIPHGAQVLASVPNLKCLMTLAIKLETAPDASNEALKCVANTLLLSEPARTRLLSQEIDGGNVCADLLQVRAHYPPCFCIQLIFLKRNLQHPRTHFSYPGFSSSVLHPLINPFPSLNPSSRQNALTFLEMERYSMLLPLSWMI
jgi:hypothetical protein